MASPAPGAAAQLGDSAASQDAAVQGWRETDLPSLDEQRRALRSRRFETPLRWRILFLGSSVQGSTDIVSSLRRALSNLGHTVLALGVSDHPDLVESLPRTITGRGPVFVRGRALEAVVDRFRPQVIICVAGGLCWREEDARALQERGILLLGLTLSDPDVFETVVDHVPRFDFHATNSLGALQQYRSRDVGNTSWFPFGIDAGFAAAEVVAPAEMRAEVICIGHAVARPQRHRVMARLAQEFKVRVYGLGWPLAGAEPVAGWRLLEAARGGRVHINFAATRAGFVNVKCGVFESVASGGVVCAGLFDEMRRFFEYGSEIVGFDSEEELVSKVREVIRDPEVFEAIRRRAFFRLVDEHLYEHRWRVWFEAIAQDVLGAPRQLSEDRVRALRPVLGSGQPCPRKVVVAGFYGARNAGDELILRSIRESLRRDLPEVEVRVAAEQPREVERIHGVGAFSRLDMAEADVQVAGASSFVLGGGGLWHDYTFVEAGGAASMFSRTRLSLAGFGRLAVLARLHGCPVHIHGLGVGPLEHGDARLGAAFLARQAASVSVRDEVSQRLLESLEGLQGRVEYHADPVFALEIGAGVVPSEVRELARSHVLIAVNLRRWPSAPAGHLGSLARALEVTALGNRAALIGVPMQDGESNDRAALQEVLDRVSPDVPRHILTWTCDPAELTAVIGVCRAVLAMRLHACVLAFRAGVPTVGLAYDAKVKVLFDALGVGEEALPVGAPEGVLVRHLEAALVRGEALDRTVMERVRHLEASARAGLKVLAARLAREPVVAVPEPIPRPLDECPAAGAQGGGSSPLAEGPDVPIDLAQAGARGGSLLHPGREVGIRVAREHGRVELQIDRNDPMQGDYALLEIQLDHASGVGQSVVLSLLSPYFRPELAGRLVYQVLLNGAPVIEEDVAMWDSVNTVRVLWPAVGPRSVLGIRVVALRDCETWNWGRAGRVVLLHLAHRALPGATGLQVLSTSPFARSPVTVEPAWSPSEPGKSEH